MSTLSKRHITNKRKPTKAKEKPKKKPTVEEKVHIVHWKTHTRPTVDQAKVRVQDYPLNKEADDEKEPIRQNQQEVKRDDRCSEI